MPKGITSRYVLKELVPTEDHEQECLFKWASYAKAKQPKLKLLHAIPNGGWRHKAVAAALKRQGVKPGIPDVCLPVPRNGFHGLYLELKRQVGGRTSEDQEEVITDLRAEGYRVEVCEGWEKAKTIIEDYLGGHLSEPKSSC